MILYFIALFYILLNFYVILRILRWLNNCHTIFRKRWFHIACPLVYALFASSLLSAFLLPASDFQVLVKKFSNYWLGTFLYILLIFFITEIAAFLLKRIKRIPRCGTDAHTKLLRISGLVILFSIFLFSIYGSFHAKQIKIKEYPVTIQKHAGERKELRIGLVSDLHLGYNVGVSDVEKMVEKLNEQNLDLICIAGDIYDNDFDAIDNPDEISRLLGKLQSTYGTFACYGNHDVSEQLLGGFSTEEGIQYLRDPRMDQMLKNAGITPLTDEARLIDRSFYLVGRLDASKTGVSGLRPKTIDEFTKTLDTSKPIFVLEHQPGELKEEEKSGVDLSMAGHTHNGQLFPGNLLVSLMWTNSYGHYQSGDFHSIVTSGLGVWGPNMRVGTDSEIVIIDVTFQ